MGFTALARIMCHAHVATGDAGLDHLPTAEIASVTAASVNQLRGDVLQLIETKADAQN